MNRAVGADRHGDAQRVDALLRADRHGDDFVGLAGFLQLNGLFDSDFVKRIDRHLGELRIDPGVVGQRPDLELGVNDALHSY